MKMVKKEELKDEYSLKLRLTKKSLIAAYVEKLSTAQSVYEEKIFEANEMLQKNLIKAIEMDTLLGTSDKITKISDDDVGYSSEGRPHHRCPISPCDSRTYKMPRHLKSHKLDPNKTEYSLNCCKLFLDNCQPHNVETFKPV